MCTEINGFEQLLKAKMNCNSLKSIVCFDEIPAEKRQAAENLGLTVYHFNDILDDGKKEKDVELKDPLPETYYMHSYTSGTTGNPKVPLYK